MNELIYVRILLIHDGRWNKNEPVEGRLDHGELEVRQGEQLTPRLLFAWPPHPTHHRQSGSFLSWIYHLRNKVLQLHLTPEMWIRDSLVIDFRHVKAAKS